MARCFLCLTSAGLIVNIKYFFEVALIFVGVFYYYIAALLQSNLATPLLLTTAAGTLLAGIIIVRHLIVRNVSRSTLTYVVAFLGIFAGSYYLGWSNVLWIALMSVPMLSINRDQYIKAIFYSSSVLFALVVALSLYGILPLEYISYGGDVEERYGAIKYSLGFDGPNQAAFAFFTILLSGLYTYGTKKLFVIAMTVATIIVGIATGSRTGAVSSLLFIVFFLMALKSPEKKVSKIIPHFFIVCAVISFFAAVTFANNQALNELSTGRLDLINQYINSEYIPSIIGSEAVYNKAEYQTQPIDNFTMYVLARYGLLGFTGFALLFYLALRKETSAKIKCLFVFVMLYGLTEAFFDIPAKNFLLPIFLYSVIAGNAKKEIV